VDHEFHTQAQKMPLNAKYTSPEIQNELINIAAKQIRENICNEANEIGLISVTVDESKDVTRKEQMSLCIRYITMPNCNISGAKTYDQC
jgi:hypothetical protein